MGTVQIPPIATPLYQVDPNGDNGNSGTNGNGGNQATSKYWWLYWQWLGSQLATNTDAITALKKGGGLVMYGDHADRPDPSAVPDGTIYAEADRSGVIYQLEGGVWRYLAGTMWGTQVPDQRPTDLGTYDAGFTFRTTDQPPRTWVWSGTEWVETTPDGGTVPVPPDAPPVTITRYTVREIYDGTFEVSVYWNPDPTANSDNFRGCQVYLEDPDISSGTQPAMNGSQQLNSAAQLSGTWAPVKEDDSFVSPAVMILASRPAARNIRVYLMAFAHQTNATLIRANKPGATPNISIPLPASAGQYVSGQEYAWVITNPEVTQVDNWDDPSGPNYHFTFDLTEPDPAIPLPPGLRPYGGTRIVYQYENGSRAIGPFLESMKPDTWFSQNYTPGSTSTIRCWFVSVDIDGRVNSIVANWTPYADVTVVYPPVGQASAPVVTGLTLSNSRFEAEPDGTLLALADLTWVAPSSPRYGGVYFYRTGVNPPVLLGEATGTVASLTLQAVNWPKVATDWTICAISVDMNGKPSDSPIAPGPNTPTVVWHIGPPALGGTGQEYTTLGGAAGVTITTEQVQNSDGIVMMRHHISGWTNPPDNSFGGMSIARVTSGGTVDPIYWDAAKGATSIVTPWEPAPAATTWDFYFVSRDMMGHRNTILAGVTPAVLNVAFTPIAGNVIPSRIPGSWWNPAEFTWPTGQLFQANQFAAQKIFVGSILRVGGGSGTDAASFAGQQNGQIAVFNASNVLRAWMGEQDTISTPDNPTSHSVFGGWFAELYIGGDSPVHAPLYATQAGVLIVGGWDVSGTNYPYISIRNNTGLEVGRMGARIGQGQAGNESTIQGAWFREFAYGGQSFSDWRMLAKMDTTSQQGATVTMRNIDKFTIDYMANYPSATNPTNGAVHLEFGYTSFVANTSDSRYWKFPGFTIAKAGSSQGCTLVDRGLILRNSTNQQLASFVIFNGDQFGSDTGNFWATFTMYSPLNPSQANVLIGSGSASDGNASMILNDQFGNQNFHFDTNGDLYMRGSLKTTGNAFLINSSQQFVGSGGINTSGPIQGGSSIIAGTYLQGTSLQSPSHVWINNSNQFVGSGGVNTSGPVTCAALTPTSLTVAGVLCIGSGNAIWTGQGVQCNSSIFGSEFGIESVFVGATWNGGNDVTFKDVNGVSYTFRVIGGIIGPA